MPAKKEMATFAGGCFWCIEAVFEQLKGVEKVANGYSGGTMPRPSYEDVCTGKTGHAEVVQVTFDPSLISYRELLEVFFSVHDPTTLNRQGPDRGTQYRSAVYYHDASQKAAVETIVKELEEEDIWKGIVTQVEPLEAFFPAEEYHQGYFRRNPGQPYCSAIVAPKVAKFRKKWAQRLKPVAA